MKAAVLHINPSAYNSLTPTMTIARFVAEELRIPLIHSEATCLAYVNESFDVLFVKFGVLKFCDYRDLVLTLYSKAKRIINLENDYAFKPDSRLMKLNSNYEVWGTIPGNSSEYLNWNQAAWIHNLPQCSNKHFKVIYHGRWRDDREKSFARYFTSSEVTVSSHVMSRKKFQGKFPNVHLVQQISSIEELGMAEAGLYLEDETSNNLYCSPAQRFYEYLQARIAVLFDGVCKNTFYQAGFEVKSFIVHNASDVESINGKRLQVITDQQQKMWYRDYKSDLRVQFNKICKKHHMTFNNTTPLPKLKGLL